MTQAVEVRTQSIVRDRTGHWYDPRAHLVRCCDGVDHRAWGVGRYEQYVDGIRGASAVAAANIWHLRELSDRGGKRALAEIGVDVRL